MTDTPETDAMEYFDAMCDPDRVVEADFARKLERKRDILKKHISIMDISHKTANDEYLKLAVENEKLERERDVAREQRDRLATALRNLCDRFLGNKSSRDITAQLVEAGKALATLNQPEP